MQHTDPVTIRIPLTASETAFTARATWRLSRLLDREGSRPVAGSAAKSSGEVEADNQCTLFANVDARLRFLSD